MYVIEKIKSPERSTFGTFYRTINDNNNPQIKLSDFKYTSIGNEINVSIPAYELVDDSTIIPLIHELLEEQNCGANGVIYIEKKLNPDWWKQECELQENARKEGYCYHGSHISRHIELTIQPICISDAENSVLEVYPLEQVLEDLRHDKKF